MGSDTQTPVQVNNPDGSLAFTLTPAGLTLPGSTGLGSVALDGAPSFGPVNLNPSGFGMSSSSPAATGTTVGQSQGAAGTVVSGSGKNYVVQLINQTKTVPAVQMQIDPTDSVPAGTAVVLVQIGTTFYMQAPVWL
jgi:hypothetical protein